MIDREEVEELLELVNVCLATDIGITPTVSDETLAALCRAWLALDGGIVATMSRNDVDALALPDTWSGQRVRIVKEVNKEPPNQNQETQKEEDPFDSWFAEHYPDIDKLGKDDPMAAGFRHAMRGSFNSK